MSTLSRYHSLRGRGVLITGGATGIGAALVAAFARQEARVAFLDIQDEAALALVETLREEGVSMPPLYRYCDVCDVPALRGAIAALIEELGPFGVLINNAANDDRHEYLDVTAAYWDQSLEVNLHHHFFAAQAVSPSMARNGGGAIVNMGSIAWILGSPDMPAYTTAKAGIVGLTRSLARRLGPEGIRVNCLMPGAIVTERQEQLWLTDSYKAEILGRQAIKRLLNTDDVANMALFLGADDSAGCTNQCFVVDGGWI